VLLASENDDAAICALAIRQCWNGETTWPTENALTEPM